MNPDLARFAQQISAAHNVGAAPASPYVGTPGVQSTGAELGNIGKLFEGGYQVLASNTAAGAAGTQAKNIATDEENAAEMARKKKIDELQAQKEAEDQKAKDLLNPEKWKQVIKDDGGYDFFDPTGQQVDVRTYAKGTNKHITDVLKNSQNPSDRQFTQDYQNIEKLGQVMQKGDKKALQKMYKDDPDLKKQIAGKTYDAIVKDFRTAYPKFFSPEAVNIKSSNSQLGNTNTYDIAPDDAFLARLKHLFGG